MYTNQTAFDAIVRHLFTMKARSRNADNTACQYRGHAGAKCAIGGIIPDSLYNVEMDIAQDSRIETIASKYSSIDHFFRDVQLGLLSMLQTTHDGPCNWGADGINEVGVESLRRAAVEYDLNTDVLREYPKNG